MKRLDLVSHLTKHGCKLIGEGGRHSMFCSLSKGTASTVPRHREVDEFLARKICRDLDVPAPE